MIIDEPALLIDFKDVYWARDGRKSIDAAIIITTGGADAAGLVFWAHVRALRN